MIELRDVPPEPQVPESQRGASSLSLRYEDVVQDGRLKLEPVTHAVSSAVWRRALDNHPFVQHLLAERILPILSRLRVEAGGGPVSVREPVQTHGTFQFVRTVDEEHRIRIRLDMWGELRGVPGLTHAPPPEPGIEPTPIGRMIAEHVLTRPFDPPESRQVDEIPGGLPEDVPMHDSDWQPPLSVLTLPRGAKAIDDAFALDPCPIVFGLGHTDSNQHVNSLVYPRLLEEAALRRFHSLGLKPEMFARFVDLSFRKPCFAGDRMRIMVRAYRLGEELGVLGAFITSGEAITAGAEPSARAHCFARMQFTP
ncbi:MAG: hypothetical protein M3Y87_00215 [Myxococcota bacterium]|nr:hypothetical protein [Myxococcota bacterium]